MRLTVTVSGQVEISTAINRLLEFDEYSLVKDQILVALRTLTKKHLPALSTGGLAIDTDSLTIHIEQEQPRS